MNAARGYGRRKSGPSKGHRLLKLATRAIQKRQGVIQEKNDQIPALRGLITRPNSSQPKANSVPTSSKDNDRGNGTYPNKGRLPDLRSSQFADAPLVRD